MSLLRWDAKRDANEAPIKEGLEAYGYQVWRVSGAGLFDLLTLKAGVWKPLEIKRRGGKRSKAQREAQAKGKSPWPLVETLQQALAALGEASSVTFQAGDRPWERQP